MLNFSSSQRRELLELGLLPEQIAEIELFALPMMRALSRKRPAKNDVIDVLDNFAKSLRSAQRAITFILGASSTKSEVLPRHAALARLIVASFEAGDEGDVLDRAVTHIAAVVSVADAAIADLRRHGATRHRTASSFPGELIDRALLNGFLKAHGGVTPLPPYMLKRSSAEGSDYRRIVELSYEASGEGGGSRERSIKAFIARRKRRRGTERESTN